MMIGVVAELWRYPVKSMLGERCKRLWLDQRGAVGDRLYAVRDEAGKFGSGKTTRRFRRIDGLFRFRAVYDVKHGDVPLLTFPDGTMRRGNDPTLHAALSAQLGMPLLLSREAEISYFDAGPLHPLTTASIRTLGASLTGDGRVTHGRFSGASPRSAQVSPKHPHRDGSQWLPRRRLAGSRHCHRDRYPPARRGANRALCDGRPRPGRVAQ
jgi:MOSC N-terminal beta barrel domain